jgi:hypothetical protein
MSHAMNEKSNFVSDPYSSGGLSVNLLDCSLDYMALWKLILAWACLAVFFLLPAVLLAIHTANIGSDPNFAVEFKWLGEYLKTVTAIIISLAGLSTVEVFKK